MRFCLAVFLAAQVSLASSGEIELSYDKQQDRLSIQAHQASLTQVLGRIAAETGMNIRIHPDVQATITLQLPPQPLERAIKQLVRGLSYILEYRTPPGSNKATKSRLVGILLLPKGKHSSELWLAGGNLGGGQVSGGGHPPVDAMGTALPQQGAPVIPKEIDYQSLGLTTVGPESPWKAKPGPTQLKPTPTKAQQPAIPYTDIPGISASGEITGDVP